MEFTFVVEAEGPIRAADVVSETQGMDVVDVQPLNRKGSSMQRQRGGMPLWNVIARDRRKTEERV